MSPEISILVVNWNTRDFLASCLNAIESTRNNLDLEIIVIDNASNDRSVEMVRENFPQVRLLENQQNVGFAKANNQGFEISRGDFILLINSDAILLEGALTALRQVMIANPQCGLVGAKLLYPNMNFQASFTDLPNLWQDFLIISGLGRVIYGSWYPSHGPEEKKGPQRGGYVEGACMLVRREAYAEISGFDEGYFMYSEDVELCKTLHDRGWQVWYHPNANVIHIGGGSSQHRRPQREGDLYQSKVRFYQRHYAGWQTSLLKFQIYFFTITKNILHRFVRFISGGRFGRPVVSLQELTAKLKEIK